MSSTSASFRLWGHGDVERARHALPGLGSGGRDGGDELAPHVDFDVAPQRVGDGAEIGREPDDALESGRVEPRHLRADAELDRGDSRRALHLVEGARGAHRQALRRRPVLAQHPARAPSQSSWRARSRGAPPGSSCPPLALSAPPMSPRAPRARRSPLVSVPAPRASDPSQTISASRRATGMVHAPVREAGTPPPLPLLPPSPPRPVISWSVHMPSSVPPRGLGGYGEHCPLRAGTGPHATGVAVGGGTVALRARARRPVLLGLGAAARRRAQGRSSSGWGRCLSARAPWCALRARTCSQRSWLGAGSRRDFSSDAMIVLASTMVISGSEVHVSISECRRPAGARSASAACRR